MVAMMASKMDRRMDQMKVYLKVEQTVVPMVSKMDLPMGSMKESMMVY